MVEDANTRERQMDTQNNNLFQIRKDTEYGGAHRQHIGCLEMIF